MDSVKWTIRMFSIYLGVFLLLLPSSNSAVVNSEDRLLRQARAVTLPSETTTPSTDSECKNSVYSIGRTLQYYYICCEQNGAPGKEEPKFQFPQVRLKAFLQR